MHKFIIIILFTFISFLTKAQHPITYQAADSITNQCYLSGDWDKLINYGEEAIRHHVEFKSLRKRIGYAYFVKNNYYSAQKHYKKALSFDSSDFETITYLYYCGINTGNNALAGYIASNLTSESQKSLGIGSSKIINALDFEYNYKANDDSLGIRSNPNYIRMGISTKLNNRLSLYQSISQYNQYVNVTTVTKQNEYFGSLNYIMTSKLYVDMAFHYLNTKIDTTLFPGYMYFGKISSRINRFELGLSGSLMTNAMGNFSQIGLNVGVSMPGKANIYLKSALTRMIETNNNRYVFSQSIGAQVLKPIWIEASTTLGNIKNYNDNNGLYIYNSLDPTIFRTGFTMFWSIGKKISLVGNYTYDIKQIENSTINYNQHSFSGGIIWKL
jgi:tetratricopeptide (TPR) repeat protein